MNSKNFPPVNSALLLSVGFLICVLGTSPLIAQLSFPNNSVAKNRVEPGAQAARSGSAVQWQPDFESAVKNSRATGKPIFWYVPTLRGSFMDRTPSIDLYMMAGPFSWPDIISVLNEHYIPVRARPNRKQQKEFGLVPYVFIEPGFLVLGPDGDVTTKLDRITTLHPKWFRHLLTRNVIQPIQPAKKPADLAEKWSHFENGNYDQVELNSPDATVEELLLVGMSDFRRGNHESAKQKWRKASELNPDHPLAWKAATEAQGIGPFVRGFEVHREIPLNSMQAGIDSQGSAAPANVYGESELWRRGSEFLLTMQNSKGGFTDSDYDFGGTDSLPNVHVAVTALAGMAMHEALSRNTSDSDKAARLESAISKAADYVSDANNINESDRDELLWAYAYRVRFLAKLAANDSKYQKNLQSMVENLERIQSKNGNWFHEYRNPFVTATALLALYEAKQGGVNVSQDVVDKGVAALKRDRFGNGAFPYSSSRGNNQAKAAGDNRQIAASAGRMPLCELGLWVWKQSDDQALANALRLSFELNENLMVALKYDDHTSRMAYGGFFFWYDLRGRSEAMGYVDDSQLRMKFQKMQRELILTLPELDGCFVDSHELGRVYGTAMALLSLAACEEN